MDSATNISCLIPSGVTPSFKRPVAKAVNRSPATWTAIFPDTFLVSFEHTSAHRPGGSAPQHSRQTCRSGTKKRRESFSPRTSLSRSCYPYGIFRESCGEISRGPTFRRVRCVPITLCHPTFGRLCAWPPTRWCTSRQGRSTTLRLLGRLRRLLTVTRSQNTD